MLTFLQFDWLKRLSDSVGSKRRRKSRSRMPRSRRLWLERLEDRTLPSVGVLHHYVGLDSVAGGGSEPPDTTSAAGPSSVVEAVNQAVAIYHPKATGTSAVTASATTFYFTNGGLTPVSSTSDQSDTFVIFDEQNQRFFVGDLDFDETANKNQLLLAVSKSSDPTTLDKSSWFFYAVPTTETNIQIQDYPGNPGYNHDALVVTFNAFTSSGLDHSLITAISMNSLITGASLTLNTNLFETDKSSFESLRPAIMHDSVAGDPMWMVTEVNPGASNTSIDVVKMTNVLNTSPTFTTYTLPVNSYSTAVPTLQPDGSEITNMIDSRFLKAAEQGGELVAAQTVSNTAGNLDNARWYEINVSSGTPSIAQQGDVTGGPGVYDAYPAIDINPQGQIGMTFIQSGKGPGQFMSMYVTGRTPSDPANTMETPVLVQAGEGIYMPIPPPPGREGDLSGINVDADGSFWVSTEFANSGTAPNWGTAIANFTFVLPAQITLTGATEGQPLSNALVATFTDNTGSFPASDYTAGINWGDGASSAGRVVATGANTFDVFGDHTYAEEGAYTLSLALTNTASNISSTTTSTVNVADAPLVGTPQTMAAKVGAALTNALVATFTDTDTAPEGAGNYTATVTWDEGGGQSVTVTGRIVALGGNTFAVYADNPNTYATAGMLGALVVVHDAGGASVTINSVVNVGHNLAIPPLVPIYLGDTFPVVPQYLNLEDALSNLLSAEDLYYLALFTNSVSSATFGNLLTASTLYELRVFQFDFALGL